MSTPNTTPLLFSSQRHPAHNVPAVYQQNATSTPAGADYQPDVASTDDTLNYDLSKLPTTYPIPASSFPPLRNDTILRAARGEPTDYTPIWVHRQAGRYLPEFKELRKGVDFFTMCQTPTLAAEVTLQPIRRFPLDAAIIFSDILVIPQCLGMTVEMVPGKGPVLPQPIRTPDDMQRLTRPTPAEVRDRLGYVMRALTLTRLQLHGQVPLIGFSGAPFTLMAYMIEGGGSKSYNHARSWFYCYPKATHELLKLLADTIVAYLVAQVEAGAQMLELFDTWASELTAEVFTEFNLPYIKQIAQQVKQQLRDKGLEVVPMTIFAKGAHYALEQLITETEFDVMSFDWNINRVKTREVVAATKPKHRTAAMSVQGNLDVSVLFAEDDVIRTEVQRMIDQFGTQRYIVNLGHGMLPEHSPAKLAVMIDEAHRHSRQVNETKQT